MSDHIENQAESESNESKQSEYDLVFRMYEKAIEGRNLHYQSYNTWMNHYAIFTGAFFIGYYTIKSSDNSINPILSLLIVLIGYISAICWRHSLSGYYAWMISWIKLVQHYEVELHKLNYRIPFVYSYADEDLKDSKEFPQNYSTQKITGFFTSVVIIGWGVLIFVELYNCLNVFFRFVIETRAERVVSIFLVSSWHDVLSCIVFFIELIVILYLCVDDWFSQHCRSNIDEMTSDIRQEPPKKENA